MIGEGSENQSDQQNSDPSGGDGASDSAGSEREIVYSASIAPTETAAMSHLLEVGTVEIIGQMPFSSNGTFFTQVRLGDDFAPAIYKPESAERPLWDFPGGLWKREIASWELSEVLGFSLVPPTVATEGTERFGRGSLQAFIPARFEDHYFTIRNNASNRVIRDLQRLCALDIVANSTDRKAGHCLIDDDDHIWAIDNGLGFHSEFKLRTVIWDFAGESIDPAILEPLRTLARTELPLRLARWLDQPEIDALFARTAGILGGARFPTDPTGRRVPWPLI